MPNYGSDSSPKGLTMEARALLLNFIERPLGSRLQAKVLGIKGQSPSQCLNPSQCLTYKAEALLNSNFEVEALLDPNLATKVQSPKPSQSFVSRANPPPILNS